MKYSGLHRLRLTRAYAFKLPWLFVNCFGDRLQQKLGKNGGASEQLVVWCINKVNLGLLAKNSACFRIIKLFQLLWEYESTKPNANNFLILAATCPKGEGGYPVPYMLFSLSTNGHT